MPSPPPGKGDNNQRGCAGRPLKEPGGRMLVGQKGAQTPQKTHLNTSFPTCPPCSAFLCPLSSSQSPVAKQNAPSHQHMPVGTLGTAPLPSAWDALACGSLQRQDLSLFLPARACPLHAPVSPVPVLGSLSSSPTQAASSPAAPACLGSPSPPSSSADFSQVR